MGEKAARDRLFLAGRMLFLHREANDHDGQCAFEDAYSTAIDGLLRERDERIRKLEGMLKVYASGHHDEAHVGRGAEDYTDCPEQICIDACDALGYREG